MKQLKRKSSKVVAFLLAVAMVATSLAYTPSSASAASKKKVTKVSITKPSTKVLVLKKGKTYKMKVKVTAKKSKYKKVTYKSSKKAVATVSKSGKIKAIKKGTAKITVTSKTDKKKKATLTVKVGTPITKVTLTGTHGQKSFYYEEVKNVDPESKDYGKVSLVRKSKTTQKRVFTKKKSASVTVTKGEYVQLKANFTPSKATYRKVSYKSSNKKVATVDSYGFVTAKEPGKTTITATAKDGSGKKATVKMTVNEFVETTTPAPTAVPDLSKKTTVENFESYADGTNWDKYTTGGQANPGTMTVVTDPLNPNNKVLKVAYNGPDQAFDFAPYFNVDLSKIPNAKATLGNYKGVKFKVRVVSSNIADVGAGQPKVINGFFADYGTINRNMANSCSYKADNAEVIANPEKFKFLQDWAGFFGEDGESAGSINAEVMNNNRYMPNFNTEYFGIDDAENEIISNPKSRLEGFAGYLNGKAETAEYSAKILNFDRKSRNCQPYLKNSKFDMTFGTTYEGKLSAGQVLEYYLDDIELIEDESGAGQVAIPATSVTLDQEAIELEVGDKRQLTASVAPEDTTDSITWETSDASIANIADGMVIAVAEGTVTITAKANDDVKATCKVTVKAASKVEVFTQVPKTTDERWNVAGKDTDEGLQFNMASDNYAGLNINLPAEITDFSKCKSVKFTFKMTDGSSTTDKIKFTIAALHKDAKSNYDESMKDPKNGRFFEKYTDVAYESASQQDDITYDTETGLYTITVNLAGQTNMDKVAAFMIARNGAASATATVTISKIEYTMKSGNEKDLLEGYTVTYPITKVTDLGFSNWDAKNNDYASLTDKGCTIAENGEVTVPGKEWDGIAIPLDNRTGEEAKDYYVEATVRSAIDSAVSVGFSGSNTLQNSKYFPGASMKQYGNEYYLKRDVLGDQTIKAKITVPAGKFGEVRLKGEAEGSNFIVKNVKVEPYTNQDLTLDKTLVKLSLPANKTVKLGKTLDLIPTASPEDADISSAVWASDNTAVATVDNKGTVTPVKEGTAKITVSVGDISASCQVTVSATAEIVENVVLVPTVTNSQVSNTNAEVAANDTKGVNVTFKTGDKYPELIITLATPIDWTKYAGVSVPEGFNVKLYIQGKTNAISYYSNTANFSATPGDGQFSEGDRIEKIGIQCSTHGMAGEVLAQDTTLTVSEIVFEAKEPSLGITDLTVDLTKISGYDATKGGVVAAIQDSTKDYGNTDCIDLPSLGDDFHLQNYSKIVVKTKTYVDDQESTDISTSVVFTTDKSDWYNKRIAEGSTSEIVITAGMETAPVAFVMQNNKKVASGTIKSVITEIKFVGK